MLSVVYWLFLTILLKNTEEIYTDEIKRGKLLEKGLVTGINIPQECLNEYNKIREEHHIRFCCSLHYLHFLAIEFLMCMDKL